MVDAKYSSHADRLATLSNWPGRTLFDIGTVARSGLYYLACDDNDRLRCAFCEFTVANWKREDHIWKLHAAFVPTCIHLLCSMGIEFVKLVLQEEMVGEERTQPLINNTTDRIIYRQGWQQEVLTIPGISNLLVQRQQQSSSCSPGSRSNGTYRTYRGVQFTMPKDREMANPNRRIQSFKKLIPQQTFPDLTVVIEAGFYYTGVSDSLSCYHCGEQFRKWKPTDEPWVEHARQAPHCMHVILTKGEVFVEKVQTVSRGKLKRSASDLGENVSQANKKLNIFGISEDRGVDRARRENIDRFVFADACGQLQVCERCKRRRDMSIGSVCCRVCVCESCGECDGNCPSCGRS